MQLTIYDDTSGLDLDAVAEDVCEHGLDVVVRPGLPGPERDAGWVDWLAWHVAATKVRHPERRVVRDVAPAALELEREAAALRGEAPAPGPLYDGVHFAATVHEALPAHERPFEAGPVVVLTDRLVATFEGARYHARYLVCGHPCVVSVPGFVEGPARARSYYLAKHLVGASASALADDDHVTRDDPRLVTCVASAVLQAARYHATGEPFCDVERCRLYNPHWQAELVEGLATRHLCGGHRMPVAGPGVRPASAL